MYLHDQWDSILNDTLLFERGRGLHTKCGNAMAMVGVASHVFVAMWPATRHATSLANTDFDMDNTTVQ